MLLGHLIAEIMEHTKVYESMKPCYSMLMMKYLKETANIGK